MVSHAPDQKTDVTRDRIAIEKLEGQVVAERTGPYRCDVDGRPNLEQLMVSIDLSDVHFE